MKEINAFMEAISKVLNTHLKITFFPNHIFSLISIYGMN